MKHFNTLIALSFSVFSSLGQVAPPEAINYSGVARDAAGDPIISSTIGLQLSILETSATGTMVYQENHSTLTDEYGRFSVALGMGTAQSGTFSTIDWGGDSHFLQTGLDPTGGTSFQLMGTTQMLSVPYALYAKEAGTVNGLGNITVSQMGDTLFNGTDTLIIPGISSANGGNSYYTPGAGVTDIDGNSYATIILANGQEWMAENLRTTKYANGDDIPNVTDGTAWSNTSAGAWCWYDNDGAYDILRGKLYNWHSATDSRNACPTGWAVPNKDDLLELVNFLEPSESAGKLKGDSPLWAYPNVGGSNQSGFNAIPTGSRFGSGGGFSGLDSETAFWGNDFFTYYSSTYYTRLYLTNGRAEVIEAPNGFGNQGPTQGSAIRCIKD